MTAQPDRRKTQPARRGAKTNFHHFRDTTEPPTAKDYTERGLPWFEYYGSDQTSIPGSDKLEDIASVAQHTQEAGEAPQPHTETIDVPHVIPVGGPRRRQVREAETDWGTHS